MSELEGRTAIVTGASRGIGAAAAHELASCGTTVVLVARSGTDITRIAGDIQDIGGRAEAVTCDVADYAAMAAAVDLCKEKFGRLDILVNNAALLEPIARLADCDPDDWARVVEVNINGVFNGLRAAIPVMIAQGGGTIINISSGAAVNPLQGWSHYCASKAAVLMLTRSTHLEYASEGIRIVGLAPGTVATGMQTAIRASGMNPISQLDPSVHIPPVWAARAIAWLCTEDARDFDGGDVSLRETAIRKRVGLL